MTDFELDTSYALYIFAAIFFLVSIIYFGAEVVFQLSPVTKSYLLFSLTALIIGTGIWFAGGIKSTLTYLTGFLSYIVFLSDTLFRFEPGTEVVLGSLLGSAVLFAAVGRILSKEMVELSTKRFRIFIGFIVLSAALLTAYDMSGPKPVYEFEFEEEVNIVEGPNRLGSVTVRNNFLITRSYDIPEYEACVYDSGRDNLYIDVADYRTDSGLIAGSSEKSFDINYSASMRMVDRESDERRLEHSGRFDITESERCPSNGQNRTIYVFQQDDSNRFD